MGNERLSLRYQHRHRTYLRLPAIRLLLIATIAHVTYIFSLHKYYVSKENENSTTKSKKFDSKIQFLNFPSSKTRNINVLATSSSSFLPINKIDSQLQQAKNEVEDAKVKQSIERKRKDYGFAYLNETLTNLSSPNEMPSSLLFSTNQSHQQQHKHQRRQNMTYSYSKDFAISSKTNERDYNNSYFDKRMEKENADDKKRSLQKLYRLGFKKMQNKAISENIPSWSEIENSFGSEPVILGLESCERYREIVPNISDRMIAPAGLFNTGTNMFPLLFRKNCKDIHSFGQVPWGKHNPAEARLSNFSIPRPKTKSIPLHTVLPVVLVRHPVNWMKATCKLRYSASWNYNQSNCPHLQYNPTELSSMQQKKGKIYHHGEKGTSANYNDIEKSVEVRVNFGWNLPNGTANRTSYTSLIHMWQQWNEAYYSNNDTSSLFPRLIVRLEDLIYHPEQVIPQICHCAGGVLRRSPSKHGRNPIQVIKDSVKQKRNLSFGKQTSGFLDAWIKHAKVQSTFNTFSQIDQAFTRDILSRKQEKENRIQNNLLHIFHYKI